MFGRKRRIITREALVAAVLRAGTPVCWLLDRVIEHDELERLARRGFAFLVDWRTETQAMKSLLAKINHDYPHHFVFLDARGMREDERRALLTALARAEVHGGIVPAFSNTFVKKCCATDRFIFVALATGLSSEALPEKIGGLLGRSRFNHRGRKNIGGAVAMRHASLFSTLESYADEFPIFISCTPNDWRRYPSDIQGAVTISPGTRIVTLPVPPISGDDRWRDESVTAARQLADTLQGAIVARR